MIWKNKLHMFLLVVLYGFGYIIPNGLYWFYTDNNLTSLTLREEMYVFVMLPASVFCILNDFYLKYDKQLFCTFTHNSQKAIYAMYLAFYALHTFLYLIGNTVFSILSYLFTGYFNIKFTITHDVVMALQLAAGLFLIFALLFLFQKSLFSYIAYGFLLFVSIAMGKNVFVIFPITDYVIGTLGYYQSLEWKLWISRIIQIILFWLFFHFTYKYYIRNRNEEN